jgi:hypothetical protein
MKEPDREWIQNQYKVYTINRKDKKRQIEEPSSKLKEIQTNLINKFEDFPFHTACHSRAGRSIATNAAIHANAKYLLRIDIKGCYQNTTRDKVEKGFLEAETRVDKQHLDYCFWFNGEHWILPTGAPTSPILCNIALTQADDFLFKYLENLGYQYTRYIDDIHISTTNNKRDWSIKNKVEKFLIEKMGYPINKRKSKWMTVSRDSAIVTGVNIGHGNRVPHQFYRMMRARLYNLAREEKPIDQETRGCLAYVKSIDQNRFNYLEQYYQRKYNEAKIQGR